MKRSSTGFQKIVAIIIAEVMYAVFACTFLIVMKFHPSGAVQMAAPILMLAMVGFMVVSPFLIWLDIFDAQHILESTTSIEGRRCRAAALRIKPAGAGIAGVAARIAGAVDCRHPVTRNFAARIAGEHPGRYADHGLFQICSLYDEVRARHKYVSDPSGDYFARASETIENGFCGDCDDVAILMAAVIEAIGGKARIILAWDRDSGHAYAEVAVSSKLPPGQALKAVQAFYAGRCEVPEIYYRETKGRWWLCLDFKGPHPGATPLISSKEMTRGYAVYTDGSYAKLA